MATFTKFNSLVEAICEKVHEFGSDQLTIALTNTAPSVGNTQLSNITEIVYTFLSSRNVTTNSSSQSAGVYSLVCADLVLSASGGSVGPFRYVVLYNDTATNDELIAYWDRGSSVTLLDGDDFTVNFGATVFTLS